MNKVFLSFLFIFVLCGDLIQAAEITWTGNGTDAYISTKENWPGNTQCFSKNGFGLMHQASGGNTYIIPAGASAIATGFDIDNTQIVINGSLVSKRELYGTWSFNGFWLRGNNTVTIGENANFTCKNGSADDAIQLTMAGSNNTLNKYDSATLTFGSIFISTYDGNGGNHNVVNQYAGTVKATQVNLGTKSGFTDSNMNYYNLYGGTVEAGQTHLNTYNNNGSTTYGRGVLNIYGSYTTGTLQGGTSTDGTNTYRSEINVYVGPDGNGSLKVTGTNTYSGIINVELDSYFQYVPASLINTPVVSLPALSGNETININTNLLKLNGSKVGLNTSNNLAGSGTFSVNKSRTYSATGVGYVEMNPVSNPYEIELTVSGLETQAQADAFASWLRADSGLNAQMNSPTQLVLSDLPTSTANQVLFLDFSKYVDATVQTTRLRAAEVYTWTGKGADAYVSTKENWPGNTQSFSKNGFGLMQESKSGSTYTIPEGASVVTTGFYINNTKVIINGSCVSRREDYNGWKFNGFWMFNGSTVTIGENADFTCVNGSATDAIQLTMSGSNNTLNKYDSATLNFENIFISGNDQGGGSHNQVNQYAGTVKAKDVQIGTNSTSFTDENISAYNLYGGTVEAQKTSLNAVNNLLGRGELNIYNGDYKTGTLQGGTSVNGSNEYKADINVHVGPNGYGTLTVTDTNSYTGNINVTLDSSVLTLPATLQTLVSLPAIGSTKISLNTPLFKQDGATVVLDSSKNLAGSGVYSVNTPLTFDATNAGYLEMAPVGNQFNLEMTVSGLGTQEEANAFATWLSEDSGFDAEMTTPTSLVLSGFPAFATNQFLFLDFSGYELAIVKATGLMAAEVPEPAAWSLLLLGAMGLLTFRRNRK